jgi:electron transfer flavoprotein alpha subunit
VVDDGILPKERLIGQTGRTVAPELYLALGISGSPHHVAGVQGAEHIVAVNSDEYAPIVSFSDTSFVGRLEDVLPALVRQLKAVRDGDPTAEDAGA